MSVDPELLKYYAGLLIIQYRIKPKAQATIKILANQNLCDGLVQVEERCFDLDTAVGAQLDVIGRIVGVPRKVYGLDLEREFYNWTTYSEPASNGFCRYDADPYPDGIIWYRYVFQGSSFYILLDAEMKILIQLKILLNNSYSSLKDIVSILHQFFPNDIEVVDNADMTITYNINTDLENVSAVALYLGFIPKPMGVELDINYV